MSWYEPNPEPAMNLNHTTLAGNLTRDPELRSIGSERTVVQFTLANNRRYKSSDGETKEETLFLDCEAWGRTAELIGQYLTKGSGVVVEGRLKLDQWTDKEGAKRSRVKLVAELVHFMDRKSDAAETGASAASAANPVPGKTRATAPTRNDPVAVGDQPPF